MFLLQWFLFLQFLFKQFHFVKEGKKVKFITNQFENRLESQNERILQLEKNALKNDWAQSRAKLKSQLNSIKKKKN